MYDILYEKGHIFQTKENLEEWYVLCFENLFTIWLREDCCPLCASVLSLLCYHTSRSLWKTPQCTWKGE